MITTATMHCMPRLYFQAHRKPGHGPSARCRSDARRQSAACHGCGIFRPEPASACGAGTATGDCRRPAPAIRARFSLPSSSAPPAGRGTGHLSGLRCLLHIGHQGIMGGGCGSRAAVVLRAQSDDRRRGRAIVKKGLDPAHYFNSGVLVFHPRRLRALFPDLMAAVLCAPCSIRIRTL